MAEKLNAGDAFPATSIALVGGGSISLPDSNAKYQVALFYRGHW